MDGAGTNNIIKPIYDHLSVFFFFFSLSSELSCDTFLSERVKIVNFTCSPFAAARCKFSAGEPFRALPSYNQNQKNATRLTCDTFADRETVDCYRYIFYDRVFRIARYFVKRAGTHGLFLV